MIRPRWLPGAALLVALAALPLVADGLRRDGPRCAADGVVVKPAYRVTVVAADGEERAFCGVRCAARWLEQAGGRPRRILVTDCVSGRELDARDAHFLRTLAGWSEDAPDFVRVFAREEDAARHAEAFGGVVLAGEERPFARTERDGEDGDP